ncbi:MAG: hypothetical protein CGW95_01455 [Phenylobacterium zucineum]|nr:MAG: hypothetical protein CGW95_01455 [Phenylobacterium zucineum]
MPTDGGRFEKHTFDAEFKRLPQSRIEEIMQAVVGSTMSDRDVVVEVMVGWKGVADAGTELLWSENNRDTILEIPLVGASIIKAWMKSLSGGREKN